MTTTTDTKPFKSANPYLLECKMEFLKALRTPQFSAPTIIMPLIFYLIFGVMLAGDDGQDRVLYLLATFGMFGAIGPAIFGFGVYVATERHSGWLDLKKIAPMSISVYLIAKLFMAALFGLIVIMLLTSVAILIGGLSISIQDWLTMLLVELLCAVPFGLLGMAIGFSVSPQAAPAIVNIVFMAMSVFGGLLMPLHIFPESLQTLAWGLPTFHAAQLSLSVFDFNSSDHLLIHALALLFFSVIMAVLANLAYKRSSSRT
jgi:ABC-2 type transport system permease protein